MVRFWRVAPAWISLGTVGMALGVLKGSQKSLSSFAVGQWPPIALLHIIQPSRYCMACPPGSSCSHLISYQSPPDPPASVWSSHKGFPEVSKACHACLVPGLFSRHFLFHDALSPGFCMTCSASLTWISESFPHQVSRTVLLLPAPHPLLIALTSS